MFGAKMKSRQYVDGTEQSASESIFAREERSPIVHGGSNRTLDEIIINLYQNIIAFEYLPLLYDCIYQ